MLSNFYHCCSSSVTAAAAILFGFFLLLFVSFFSIGHFNFDYALKFSLLSLAFFLWRTSEIASVCVRAYLKKDDVNVKWMAMLIDMGGFPIKTFELGSKCCGTPRLLLTSIVPEIRCLLFSRSIYLEQVNIQSSNIYLMRSQAHTSIFFRTLSGHLSS